MTQFIITVLLASATEDYWERITPPLQQFTNDPISIHSLSRASGQDMVMPAYQYSWTFDTWVRDDEPSPAAPWHSAFARLFETPDPSFSTTMGGVLLKAGETQHLVEQSSQWVQLETVIVNGQSTTVVKKVPIEKFRRIGSNPEVQTMRSGRVMTAYAFWKEIRPASTSPGSGSGGAD